MWEKIDEPYHEYVLNWRKIDGQSNIYVMSNLNSSVLTNYEFQKKGITSSWWKIIWQKEIEVNWITFYILEYSLNSNDVIVYVSMFQFLTPDKSKFISLNILWKNYEKNVELLDNFINNIIIKN